MSANFKLIDFFWRERMPLIHVGNGKCHAKRQMGKRRGISVRKGEKLEQTCNQQSFSLSKKRSIGQKQFFDNEWVMFESSARVNLLMI